MELPAGLVPWLSRNADSDLRDSISVSNAESQLALPFTMTPVFGASVICSPKGSAVWTGAAAGGAGVSAAAGGVVGAADGLAAGGGGAGGAGGGGGGATGTAEP